MEKGEFIRILKKYNEGTASYEEKQFLDSYYNSFEVRPDVVELLDVEEKTSLKEQIKAGLQKDIAAAASKETVKRFPLLGRIAAAAIILITLSAGVYFYIAWENGDIYPAHYYSKHDILPGGNKAILTLANGQQIILGKNSNGLLAIQGNTRIVKSAAGQIAYNGQQASANKQTEVTYNMISVPKGGQYQVTLPDGSRVLLNSASSLHFPTAFNGDDRKVELTGEAYFEVAHDKTKPFKVITGNQTVEVLGTHFNINAYSDESTLNTTLLEGSVKVFSGNQEVVIKPGEQAQIITGSNAISVIQNADTEQAVAWKNGLFQFKDASLETIMRSLSRWYDVDIEYDGEIPERKFSGKIYRKINITQALEIINFWGVRFHIEKTSAGQKANKIIVTP